MSAITALVVLCSSVGRTLSADDRPNSNQQRQRLLQRFPDADTNKDGVLSDEEIAAYRKKVTQERNQPARVQPTHANVAYGSHERHVLDFWAPSSEENEDAQFPLLIFFHGGGFVAGDKSSFDPRPFLDAGMAVVSANYRFVDGKETLSPTPLHDGARVVQFVRTKAKEWQIDPNRIALSGNSAGAVMSLWIGFHDDLANPSSDDPVARESSRVACIAPLNGPTILEPDWIHQRMGGPPHIHGSFPKMFGAEVSDSMQPEVQKRILETSPIRHLTKDDPPALLVYNGKNEGIPLPESASTGVLIHHAYFGEALKARMDEIGVPCEFHPGTNPSRGDYNLVIDWIKDQFQRTTQ
ncbi:MAG: alpha/beta hydrolase [Planctomycetaceae bacterium]|nr:alpha/beta hydrolase [Planctomycetaceae bacterium]